MEITREWPKHTLNATILHENYMWMTKNALETPSITVKKTKPVYEVDKQNITFVVVACGLIDLYCK